LRLARRDDSQWKRNPPFATAWRLPNALHSPASARLDQSSIARLWVVCATTEYAGSIELCATVVVVFKGALRPTKLDACSGGLVRTSTGAGTVPDWIWTKSAFARIVIKPAARHADKSSGSYTDILAAVAVLLATPTEPHTPKLGAMPIESRPTRRPTNAPPSI
jgi:hypothetical protein